MEEKKPFVPPEIEVKRIEVKDIIATSVTTPPTDEFELPEVPE